MIDLVNNTKWIATRDILVNVAAVSGAPVMISNASLLATKNRKLFIKCNAFNAGCVNIFFSFHNTATTTDYLATCSAVSPLCLAFSTGGCNSEIYAFVNAGNCDIRITEFELQ